MKLAFAAATAALLLAACGGSETPAATMPETAESAAPAPAPAAVPAGAMGPVAGRWQNTVTAGGMSAPPSEWCYDQSMSMESVVKMQQQAGITCSEQTFSPDGKSGHSVCMMDATKITTDFKVTGDYATEYTMEVTSSMDPAMPGIPNPSTTTIAAKRLGDCTADTPRIPMPQ